jgi:hypothetical protein
MVREGSGLLSKPFLRMAGMPLKLKSPPVILRLVNYVRCKACDY